MQERYSLKDIIKFFDDVSALVDDIFFQEITPSLAETYFEPATDLFEVNDKIFLIIELPGVKKKDLSIAVGPTMVLIHGWKRRMELMQEGTSFYNLEIPYGRFKKRIYLPSRINVKSTKVSLKDGLLKMEFLKDIKTVKIIKIE
ncbi:MAG: Hsp20/alpha crystallin family protein [candidate division WOR-3 bacterium]|nr:Hsp20/alpha crystallin family protein [candidate division WOR-3 bacterium]